MPAASLMIRYGIAEKIIAAARRGLPSMTPDQYWFTVDRGGALPLTSRRDTLLCPTRLWLI